MFGDSLQRSRFVSMRKAVPVGTGPTLAQVLTGFGLVAMGTLMGLKLAPLLRRWQATQAAAKLKAPKADLDRWANEGGAVVAPEFTRPT